MGRTKSHVDPELTFAPKISDNSRKLALLKIYAHESEQLVDCVATSSSIGKSIDIDSDLPHFMKSTVSRRESVTNLTLAPLKKVPSKKKLSLGKKITKVKDNNVSTFNNLSLRIAKEKGAKIHADIMAKAATMPTAPNSSRVVDDAETFTFKPKVSSRSASIAESLGTDFMARNQQHIEKQKKLLDQSISNHRTINPYTGRLSPVLSSSTPKAKKSTNTTKLAKESSNLAWSTPDGTKILTAANTNTKKENEGSPARLTRSGTTLTPIKHPSKSQSSGGLAAKSLAESPYNTSNVFRKKPLKKTTGTDSDTDDDDVAPHLSRSKTMPPPSSRRLSRKSISSINLDRLKNAKTAAEKAIKHRKIFTIQGPYSIVRKSLRRRGWVEKFYKPSVPQKRTPRTSKSKDKSLNDSDDDDDDDDDVDDDDTALDAMKNDENTIPPWEEEGGIYGIMSRIVRNSSPTFIWCIRRDAVDYRFLNKDQMVNHYCKAGSFTTKVGLCVNLRNVSWYDDANCMTFFPRCYKLSMEEEKAAFIDDFRLTACQSIIRYVIQNYSGRSSPETKAEEEEPPQDDKVDEKDKKDGEKDGEKTEGSQPPTAPTTPLSRPKKPQGAPIGMRIIDQAIQQCERWLAIKAHMDIDRWDDPHLLSDSAWDQLIHSYYRIINDGAIITNAASRVQECELIASKMRQQNPQFDMDGTRNVWIVKPGAKSRGRGIMVYDNLDEMCKLVSSSIVKKEGKYVVQKYIERPLLVYNTKFDIRQWFLVTDWNPLTIWFYKECYLRFCSQQFTLDNFNEAIHLSNFSIQKHYSNGPRSKSLPRDNMWDSETFKQFLAGRGQGQEWEEKIYPGMKQSVICSLLSTQDVVEYRKSSFELYGADFMLTDDLNPWLIEINSSPTMSASTPVTTRLCHNVIEDTMKVVIDRKYDRNCDTGDFELAFKQNPVTVPPYIGINLSVEGQGIRKPYTPIVIKNTEDNPYMQKVPAPKMVTVGKTAPSSAPSQSQSHGPVKYSMTHAKTPPVNASKDTRKDSVPSCDSNKKEKDSKPSASNSSTKQDSSVTESENSSVKSGSITSSKTETKKSQKVSLDHKVLLVEREKLPMRMTHVSAADFKPVKMGNKGSGTLDGLQAGRPCSLCGNGMSLHLDSNLITCKCRQDSLCIDLSNKRAKSAHAPMSARTQALLATRSPSVTVPRDHHQLLAAVYNRGPTTYNINANINSTRRVLGYTDAGIKRPKSPLRISPKALPSLIRRMQSRKNGILNVAPMYRHSKEYSLVRSTFPNFPKS